MRAAWGISVPARSILLLQIRSITSLTDIANSLLRKETVETEVVVSEEGSILQFSSAPLQPKTDNKSDGQESLKQSERTWEKMRY